MTDPGLMFKIVFISTLAFTLILLSVQGAPADLQNEITKNCSDSDESNVEENEEYIIDQSQNGTDNYRINVKDVVVVWAPVSSLLAATALLNAEDFLGSQDLSELNKPQNGENEDQLPLVLDLMENKPLVQNSSEITPPEKENEKPELNPLTKPAKLRRSGLNFPALIGPFLKRNH